MKNNNKKSIALKKAITLIDAALYSQSIFADDYIKTAKKIISKYKIKIPFEYRILFCKHCKKFIIPGKNARIRIGRSTIKALRITCNRCGYTYRKIIKSKNECIQ
ncbi:MAG: RNase P subunit [Candidatus Nitrosocosmicus sp.]